MYKIISFSLWGDDTSYMNGCIENIRLAAEIYPGWTTRFYCDSKVPREFLDKLQSMGAEVVVMNTIESPWEGLFWRFLPVSESDVDIFISRDIDSRLNVREKAAVDEWLESPKLLHCMRDHIEHNVPILGGMWGAKRGLLNDIAAKISVWGKFNYKGSDQDFLKEHVWEPYIKYALVHDRFSNGLVIQDGKHEERIYVPPEPKELPPIVEGEAPPEPEVIIPPDYYYDPKKFFGDHDIRPFPHHAPMGHGVHVGERIP